MVLIKWGWPVPILLLLRADNDFGELRSMKFHAVDPVSCFALLLVAVGSDHFG